MQAIDNNGSPSYISLRLDVSLQRFVPPTKPENLRAGNVVRQGENVQYTFPENSGISNVTLGPEREIALRWEPSTDNVSVAGYNIYRVQNNPMASSGLPSSRREAPAPNVSVSTVKEDLSADSLLGQTENLVGSTTETFFVDKGLEFVTSYTYYVEATDADGNRTGNQVSVVTDKSTLADLKMMNGSQNLTLNPAFAYYQNEYTLNVENTVKSITLLPKKTDPKAKVMINGTEVAGDGSAKPFHLEPGENTILIDVIPRETAMRIIRAENTRYTLTINRANVANLPVLTLPETGTVMDEGSIYKASGRLDIPDGLVWIGTADYGDGSGETLLQPAADGSFSLEHRYLDNGKFKLNVNFRYKDLGLVKGSLEVTVQNVVPTLILKGIKDDEVTTKEGAPLTIAGSIIDPGQDRWTITGDYGSEWGPTKGIVNEDKTFILQDYFNDQKPEYDMVLKAADDDGGVFSQNIKIHVENVAPTVVANGPGMIQRGVAFTEAGNFTDPGLDKWQATVDYGSGSGLQPLFLKNDKNFALNHIYLKTGSFTVTVKVEDQNGGAGSVSLPVKVKDYLFSLEAGPDASLKEGEKLERGIPVQGLPGKIKSVTVDYGDGTGEHSLTWSTSNPGVQSGSTDSLISQSIDRQRNVVKSSGEIDEQKPTTQFVQKMEPGWLPLQHVYTENGTYTVKTKIIDLDGDSYEDSFKVEVANVPPTVQLESIGNMNVGSTFTCHGSITDPGTDSWTATIDFKDGSAPSKISVDSDKTFSFSHSYSSSGNYNIEAVVQDDDGGIGRGSQQATVLSPSSGSGAISNDASLHSLVIGVPITQNDVGYTDSGFTPDCLHYTSGGGMLVPITVTANAGATIKYTSAGGPITDLPQNTMTMVNLPLIITVTAADGVTTREYTFV